MADPVIDGRDRTDILADLVARIPGYVPEWSSVPATPAYALLSMLARDVEIQAQAENGMPARARLAFLSTLGNNLLPAQAAGTPLVFQLMANAPMDVTLSGGSQVAAKLPPPPPSLLDKSTATPDAPIFSTDETITLTRAQLTTVYSVDPNADTYIDHSSALLTGFAFFDAMQAVPHQLYLGHDQMFRLPGSAYVELSITLAASYALTTPRPLLLDWEYLSIDGWLPLRIGDDQTARLTQDGRVQLWLDFGPDAEQDVVGGISSYWIRATVSSRVPSANVGPLPGGYPLTWKQSGTLKPLWMVTVDGVNSARIVGVHLSTITLDHSLAGALPGAVLTNFNNGDYIGRISQAAGQTLVLDGVDTGRTITIAGGNAATVLGASGDVAVLDQPLIWSGGAHPTLLDAQTNEPVGTLVSPATAKDSIETNFTVPVDSGAEFLVGDIVTIDGDTEATVKSVQAQSVTLQAPIGNATIGNQLVLANALPVLRPEGADASGVLPSLTTMFARVGFTKSDLQPDSAACDGAPLDVSNTFYPFGKFPQKFTTFYVASEEVFQRQNAQVVLTFTLAQAGAPFDDDGNPGTVKISIEYFDGTAWNPLGPAQSLVDQTQGLTVGGLKSPKNISFICPDNWQATTVNGQSLHWLRMRIDDGNYGHPLELSVDTSGSTPTVVSEPATLQPPVIASLQLQYTFLTNSGLVQHCLSYNDFVFTDHSEDVQWPRRPFQPFTPVGDLQPAVHFGFSQQLPAGLVSLYFAAGGSDTAAASSSQFIWEYASANGWTSLSALDSTNGFSDSGFVQFVGPPDAAALSGLGGSLYWVRARLKPDLPTVALPGQGLWVNAVEAHQGQAVQDDTLGTSDGNPGQTFVFAPMHVPVLPGETIQVREWSGRGNGWQTAVLGVSSAELQFDLDPTDGVTVIGVWVTWHSVDYFYDSGPNDRHYTLERATGLLEFPTPPYGMIPPAGSLITANYFTGGGLSGNVPAGTVTELHSGVSYVQLVSNPLPATGGSATELVDRAQDRSTQRLRNRARALTAADFEWIACEASPEVARARCLPTTGPDGSGQLGFVTMVIVPNSVDAVPMPSAGLLSEVQSALTASACASVSTSILLESPVYTPLSVRADIVPIQITDAAVVEARVRDQLNTFLHPLLGGTSGSGWDFGQAVYQSQLATLLETTEGVDCIPLLQMLVNGAVIGDTAEIAPNCLVTSGDHQLKIVVAEG